MPDHGRRHLLALTAIDYRLERYRLAAIARAKLFRRQIDRRQEPDPEPEPLRGFNTKHLLYIE